MTSQIFGEWQLRVERGGPKDFAYVPIQTHGQRIVTSGQLTSSRLKADGIFISKDMPEGGIATADCMPLVLFGAHEALLLHISRKTLVAGILDSAKKYLRDFSVADVYIGPHICPQHFIFEKQGPDILRFAELFPNAVKKQPSGWSLSLRGAVRDFINELGVPAERVIEDGRCTFEDKDLLSYRRALVEENRVEELRMVTSVHREP